MAKVGHMQMELRVRFQIEFLLKKEKKRGMKKEKNAVTSI